ncbi:hypothetical protein FACS1894151_00960 [Spirochaetia bacterium]|nr:hypothetical protein FACS1894151_00960 [Spirochaetia bacterium]
MILRTETTTEQIENIGGLPVAGTIAEKIGLLNIRTTGMENAGKVLMTEFGNLVLGQRCFEGLRPYRGNSVYQMSLGLTSVYAPETVRIYLDKLAAEKSPVLFPQLRACNLALLKKVPLTSITVQGREYIPVDIDVSPMDNSKTKKEGVSRTYKGCDGYAPIFAYIGAEGYMLYSELREGSQHCQKNTPQFIEQLNRMIAELNVPKPVVFRLDGGNDSLDTIVAILKKQGQFFIIKRNPRKDIPEQWLDTAKALGNVENPREGKTVFTGVITKTHPCAEKCKGEQIPDLDCVFKITERTIDKHGSPFLVPDIEIETWWTNMYEGPQEVIELYHNHGTSEQFHSELKYDMDFERLPSGKFAVNAILLSLATIAFNVLRFIGQSALAAPDTLPVVFNRIRAKVQRMRLRKVIFDLIQIPCKIVHHARELVVKVYEYNPWLPVLNHLQVAALAF